MNRSKKNWNLLADIGGTNARFAIEDFDRGLLKKCIVTRFCNMNLSKVSLMHLFMMSLHLDFGIHILRQHAFLWPAW